jgi:hypothetical protein
MRRIWLISLVFFGVACGEIERAELSVRPNQDDFASDVQPLLVSLGCSSPGGCHDLGLGNVLIKANASAADLELSFLSVKAQIDREQPEQSRIIQSVLAENPTTQHIPAACITQGGCAWQKLVAWIAWDGEGDPRPSDIVCDFSAEGCFR